MNFSINSDSEAYIHALSLAETAPNKRLKEECLKMAAIIENSLTQTEAIYCRICFENPKKDLNY